jgi:hypothetical protein
MNLQKYRQIVIALDGAENRAEEAEWVFLIVKIW